MKRKVKISQCMIVKNEENNIRRALTWCRDIADEQIVVDTGSQDATVEIARELGAKVYHFDWIDDFAAAKNYAIKKAKGDWIVFLDADEYLRPEDVKRLAFRLDSLGLATCHGLVASWIQVDGSEDVLEEGQEKGKDRLKWQKSMKADGTVGMALSGTQIRIFRNLPGLRYRGRIHEKLFFEKGELLCEDASRELAIYHTGYTPAELEGKKKVERNIALVKKELEDHPRDYKLMSYLGDSYFQQKKQEEAAIWYEQAVRHLPRQLEEDFIQAALIFKHLLLIYMDSSRESAAVKAYQEGVRRFPQEADYDYLLGRWYARKQQFGKGSYHLQRAITLLDRYGSGVTSALLTHNLMEAWELLAICHYENGDLQQCVSCSVTILKADPWREEALRTLLAAFRQDEATPPVQVVKFLMNFYDFQKPEACSFVEREAKDAGYGRLAEALEGFKDTAHKGAP